MNKPTREQIEHRAIELMLEETKDSCEFCDKNYREDCFDRSCKNNLMETALRKAEEELTKPKYFSNDENRRYFQKQLADLIGATDHRYKYFEKSLKPVPHMKFYIYENEYDMISGIWGTAYSLNYDEKYFIEELLG